MLKIYCCCSVTKSCPTLRPHGLQHSRPPCPSLCPGVCLNSCLLSQWCYLTILYIYISMMSIVCPSEKSIINDQCAFNLYGEVLWRIWQLRWFLNIGYELIQELYE